MPEGGAMDMLNNGRIDSGFVRSRDNDSAFVVNDAGTASEYNDVNPMLHVPSEHYTNSSVGSTHNTPYVPDSEYAKHKFIDDMKAKRALLSSQLLAI